MNDAVKGATRTVRWFLLPLIFFIVGQFLEGPSYRVIVRGWPFILACFALSGVAAYTLRQRFRVPSVVSIVQALLVPTGFIFAVQQYYDGGINTDYATAVVFSMLAMGVNGLVYLSGLFEWGDRKREKLSPRIEQYEVKLFTLDNDGTLGRLKYHAQGETSPPQMILLEGFSQDQYIDLEPYWNTILDQQLEEFRTDIVVHETIIKFGETMQLTDPYRLQISICYR